MHRENIAALILGLGIVGALSFSACVNTAPMGLRGDHEVEGRIVDVRGERMRLNNGMEFLIPQDVARWSQLALGSVVRVHYEDRDGQKVATSMFFTEGAEGRHGL
jgi:hypothetical protein